MSVREGNPRYTPTTHNARDYIAREFQGPPSDPCLLLSNRIGVYCTQTVRCESCESTSSALMLKIGTSVPVDRPRLSTRLIDRGLCSGGSTAACGSTADCGSTTACGSTVDFNTVDRLRLVFRWIDHSFQHG